MRPTTSLLRDRLVQVQDHPTYRRESGQFDLVQTLVARGLAGAGQFSGGGEVLHVVRPMLVCRNLQTQCLEAHAVVVTHCALETLAQDLVKQVDGVSIETLRRKVEVHTDRGAAGP